MSLVLFLSDSRILTAELDGFLASWFGMTCVTESKKKNEATDEKLESQISASDPLSDLRISIM